MIRFFLQFFSITRALLLLPLALFLYLAAGRWKLNRDLAALGGRAPKVRSRVPGGFDFIYNVVQSFLNNSSLDFWDWMFEHNGGAAVGNFNTEIILLGNLRMFLTADPENIKAILTTQFADYGKGKRFHDEWEPFLGDSIFTTDGDQWHDARQLIRPMFIRERVGDLDLFERHVQNLLSLVRPGDGRVIRIDELLFRFTIDAATDFLFGRSVGSLKTLRNDFATAFNEVQRIQSLMVRAGITKGLISKKGYYENIRKINDFIEPYITEALQCSPAELERKLSKTDSFLHALARYSRDRKLIRDQLVAILLAGRDTTASSLSWAFLELARNPGVVEKMRAEIIEHLGPNGRKPTYEDIKDMKYLTSVINETLRLYPVVPFNVRTSLVDTTLPRGGGPDGLEPVGIKADTAIGYSTLKMHRRRDLYPPLSESFPYDPADWVPERWQSWTPKSWQFIPFNGGPRICIGQNFAMTEMAYVLIRFLQEFDGIKDYGNRVVLKAEIVLTPAEGVKVGFCQNARELGLAHEKVLS